MSDIANPEPQWLQIARAGIGQKEIPGPRHNAWILRLWVAIKRRGIKDDDTAWCSPFVGAAFEACGIVSTRFESAKSWLDWGQKLAEPVLGCVVVFSRAGGGHVGFVVGQSAKGILVLGGNQDNEVSIAEFRRDRIVGYRWPKGVPVPDFQQLALGSASQTKSEA